MPRLKSPPGDVCWIMEEEQHWIKQPHGALSSICLSLSLTLALWSGPVKVKRGENETGNAIQTSMCYRYRPGVNSPAFVKWTGPLHQREDPTELIMHDKWTMNLKRISSFKPVLSIYTLLNSDQCEKKKFYCLVSDLDLYLAYQNFHWPHHKIQYNNIFFVFWPM